MSHEHEEKTAHHPKRVWATQTWLTPEALESLAELNDQCLELLREEARNCCIRTGHPLLADLRDLWVALDAAARRRASGCPYLLVDAGFMHEQRWAWVRGHHVRDEERVPQPRFFNTSKSVTVCRLVLTYAWHLTRSQKSAARLLLGMSSHCVDLIAACTLKQITDLAELHPEWLQPRWPGHIRVWRELLTVSISGATQELEQVRTRGIQLLAAESLAGKLKPSPFG